MTRDITGAVQTAAQQANVAAEYLVELDFGSGMVRVWSGVGTLSWNGQDWIGVGALGSIGVIEEKDGAVATGVRLELAVTDTALLSTALDEHYQGRSANIWLALFDTSTLAVIADPVKVFGGVMDNMTVVDTGKAGRITVNAESYLRVLDRANERRRTDQDQQARFAGDLGHSFVAKIQDIDINWGAPDAQQTKRSRKRLRKR
ncbi:MAG: hypothetical protein ACE363_05925 [Alphaproteobacteria bacterium]